MSRMEERIFSLEKLAEKPARRARGSWLLADFHPDGTVRMFPAEFFLKKDRETLSSGMEVHHHQEVKASVGLSVQVYNTVNQTVKQSRHPMYRHSAGTVKTQHAEQVEGQEPPVSSLPLNSYQWYLHTSLLKDIRQSQIQLATLLKQPGANYNTAGGETGAWQAESPVQILSSKIVERTLRYMRAFLFDADVLTQTDNSFFHSQQRSQNSESAVWHPTLYFVTGDSGSAETFVQNQAHYHSDVEIRKNIKVEDMAAPVKGTDLERTVQAHVNMDQVTDRVYRAIEEKMRYERLRKGLL